MQLRVQANINSFNKHVMLLCVRHCSRHWVRAQWYTRHEVPTLVELTFHWGKRGKEEKYKF